MTVTTASVKTYNQREQTTADSVSAREYQTVAAAEGIFSAIS